MISNSSLFYRAIRQLPRQFSPFITCNRRIMNIQTHIRHQSTAADATAATLLQKNLIQANNMLSGYGYGVIGCAVFDNQGNLNTSFNEMKREELVTKHGLLPRDLRKIEKSKQNDLVPSLLVRQNGILISLLNYKALIKPNMVITFTSSGSGISLNSSAHLSFMNDLKLRLQNSTTNQVGSDPLPYEFRALEAIFISALSNLTSELKVLLSVSEGVLTDLEYSITRDKLKLLLIQNKKLSTFNKKAGLVRELIDDLLEQDDVLCEMYLTDNQLGIEHYDDDHAEIEMLLETYHNHIDELVQKTENAISNVKSTEEIINIILDSNRNQLMLLGIKFSLGLLSLCGAILFGSAYGMNLENFIEYTNYGFIGTIAVGIISTVCLYAVGIRTLHRLQKVSLLSRINRDIKK